MISNYITNTKSYLWGLVKAESKTPAQKGGDSGIIIQLAKEFTDRARAEVANWRSYMDAAENPDDPRWQPLQDLIDNMKSDGHLIACINIRKAATMSCRFMIKDSKTGKEIPEQTALLQTQWFYEMVGHLLDAIFQKYTVQELVDPTTFTWKLIPRRNCCPQKTMVYFETMGNKGVNYKDPAFARNVISLETTSPFGIINDIIPQLIWKRNAQQTWADFADRFGIPLISAETQQTDKKKLAQIKEQLTNMGQAAQAILPEGTKITIHSEAQKGDPHKIFLEQINLANDEISKAVLGGTMITNDGSSRAQSEVHERTLDEKITESDRRMIEFFVTGQLIPLLRTWGFKFTDNSVFEYDRSESLNLSDHWKIVNDALTQGLDIDTEWITSTFNVPVKGRISTTTQNTPPAGKTSQGKAAFSSNFR